MDACSRQRIATIVFAGGVVGSPCGATIDSAIAVVAVVAFAADPHGPIFASVVVAAVAACFAVVVRLCRGFSCNGVA